MNMIATNRSVSAAPAVRRRRSSAATSGGSSGRTAMSLVGRSWQASRTLRAARNRASTAASCGAGGGRWSAPRKILMRQVEQRPRPPQIEACGIAARRLASRTASPRGMRTAPRSDRRCGRSRGGARRARARRAPGKHQCDDPGIGPVDPNLEAPDVGRERRVGEMTFCIERGAPRRVVRQRRRLTRPLRDAKQGQRRQQHGEC